MINKHERQSLGEILILSNTPSYLYNKFIANHVIGRISRKYSTDRLINLVDYILIEEEISFYKSILLYAAIFSLLKKEYIEIEDFIKGLDQTKIRWGREIKNIFLSGYIPQNLVCRNLNYKVSRKFSLNSASESSIEEKTNEPIITII